MIPQKLVPRRVSVSVASRSNDMRVVLVPGENFPGRFVGRKVGGWRSRSFLETVTTVGESECRSGVGLLIVGVLIWAALWIWFFALGPRMGGFSPTWHLRLSPQNKNDHHCLSFAVIVIIVTSVRLAVVDCGLFIGLVCQTIDESQSK